MTKDATAGSVVRGAPAAAEPVVRGATAAAEPVVRGALGAAEPEVTGAPAEPVADEAPVAEEIVVTIPGRTGIEVAVIVIAVVAAIAAARVAAPVLVPVVAGILLSYTLRPLVAMLERVHIPRAAGSAVVIAVLIALVSATIYAIRDDFNQAVAELPSAARKLRQAATESARAAPGPMAHVKEAAAELDKAAAEAAGKSAATVEAPPAGVTAEIQGYVSAQSALALEVMTQIAVALLLALFLLAAGDTFRRKVAHLAGESLARRRVTVEVLNEIDAQIQNYMLTLLVTNVLIALATWAALLLLGVPNAGMWATITGVLHVIPYAGSLIAAAGVGVAAFLQANSLADAMVAMTVIIGIAAVIGIGFATWMQGRAARMNPVAVFIGVLFFGWLWGGWGLLLGMPILAVLKSVADRVESMHGVSELLGA